MDDQFEKFILENREAFDNSHPSNQSWDNINNWLNRKKFLLDHVWKVAAILFLVSTVYMIINKGNQNVTEVQLGQEFMHAEDYYMMMINQRKQQIRQQFTYGQKEDFLSDINQLDSMYVELKKNYQINTSNERVVDAMINNLQWRLDILNTQLEILGNIKSENNATESIIKI